MKIHGPVGFIKRDSGCIRKKSDQATVPTGCTCLVQTWSALQRPRNCSNAQSASRAVARRPMPGARQLNCSRTICAPRMRS